MKGNPRRNAAQARIRAAKRSRDWRADADALSVYELAHLKWCDVWDILPANTTKYALRLAGWLAAAYLRGASGIRAGHSDLAVFLGGTERSARRARAELIGGGWCDLRYRCEALGDRHQERAPHLSASKPLREALDRARTARQTAPSPRFVPMPKTFPLITEKSPPSAFESDPAPGQPVLSAWHEVLAGTKWSKSP